MRFRGGEFSTGTMGNFQPELTGRASRDPGSRDSASHQEDLVPI